MGGNKLKMRGSPRTTNEVTTQDYFHGVMSRSPAVRILTENGLADGLYLVRLSPREANQYAIAVCYHRNVYHYAIEIRVSDGKYKIDGGQWHANIRDLIRCHSKSKAGMICRTTTPCKRPPGKGPYVWPGVTSDQLMREAERQFYSERDSVLGLEGENKLREKIVQRVKKDFYKLQPWYFRDMNRAEAEASLLNHNDPIKDGQFLVRIHGENMNVLSVVYKQGVIHYQILSRTTATGAEKYFIEGLSTEFDYLMDLITLCHYDGLVCALSDPCVTRSPARRPSQPVHPILDQNIFFPNDSCLTQHPPSNLERNGRGILENEVELHHRLMMRVKHDFHKTQPWFFGQMSRAQAEKSLLGPPGSTGPAPDGRYLVRLNADSLYVLSLVFDNAVVHYPIRTKTFSGSEKFCIDGLNKEFDYLVDLIAMVPRDGLVCALGEACPKSSFTADHSMDQNVLYPICSPTHAIQPAPVGLRDVRSTSSERDTRIKEQGAIINEQQTMTDELDTRVKALIADDIEEEDSDDVTIDGMDGERGGRQIGNTVPTPPRPDLVGFVQDWIHGRKVDKRGGDGDSEATTCSSGRSSSSDAYYQSPRQNGVFNITPNQLTICDEGNLGTGQFSTVKRGTYTIEGSTHNVAVKTLKQFNPSVIFGESELIREARLMRSLDNPYIIRLIGLCDDSSSQCIMLVMEIAPGGPLRDYLLEHKETNMSAIFDILTQVANGMAYLESMNVVHRDLAARNVLLVDKLHAKISDFGLSRALKTHQQYYRPTRKREKLPLKWYPPECFDGRKFDSKSDVWSYGITMWEATSYAKKPYKDMPVENYMSFIKDGHRLSRPEKCPPNVYRIMQSCWIHAKKDRPSFQEILHKWSTINVCFNECNNH